MSERALRGTRLGATSYETDRGIDLAPRQVFQNQTVAALARALELVARGRHGRPESPRERDADDEKFGSR